MPLQTTHPLTDPSGNYRDELLAFLNIAERFIDRPYIDKLPSPAIATIGYGFNIETVSAYMALTLNQLGILGNKTAGETQEILGQFIVAATRTNKETDLRAGLNILAKQYGVPEFKITDPQARTIYDQILSGASIAVTGGSPLVIQGKQARLDSNLGNSLAHDTKEYVALMSLFYNAESLVGAGSKLATAVINDSRAEAWYEIRYKSNGGASQSSGIADRRIAESNLFSLYENPGQGVGEAEAKAVLRMYTTHHQEIQAYESQFSTQFSFSGTATIQFQLLGAKTTLIPLYSAGHTIDGEVLVGTDTGNTIDEYGSLNLSRNDLIFGEGGNDFVYGHGGDDVLYGGAGADTLQGDAGNDHLFGGDEDDTLRGGDNDDVLEGGEGIDTLVGGAGIDTLRGGTEDDILIGGADDDLLEGGEGNDTYYINSLTDGSDTIEDSDATGVIKVDGRVLTGGIKKPGDQTFKQGSFEYRLEGGHLKLGVGGSTLTINAHFEDGQFGIRLIDRSSDPTGAAPTIDYANGQPTVRYDGDAMANQPTFTAAANHDVYGYGGNDVLNLSTSSALFNHQLFGGDDDDELSGGGGQDRLFGDAGLDVLFGGAGDDVLDGGTGDDLLNGGVGQDVLVGGLDNDSLRGDSGDDVLVGGEGDDLMFGDDRQLDPTRPIGKDYLDGGAGADWLFGGLGNDVLVGALTPFSMERMAA